MNSEPGMRRTFARSGVVTLLPAMFVAGCVAGSVWGRLTRDPLAAGDWGEMEEWFLSVQTPLDGHLEYPAGEGEPIRAVLMGSDRAAPYRAQLSYPCPPLLKGHAYALSFRARADRPREADVRVMQDHPDFVAMGVSEPIALNTRWQEFDYRFTCTMSDASLRVVFNLGASDTACEVAQLKLLPTQAASSANDRGIVP